MTSEKIIEKALVLGFHAASALKTKDIPTDPDFRKFCEANDCGNYGKNYACPPVCGTPEEMRAKIDRFENAVFLKTSAKGINVMSAEDMVPLKKRHNALTLKLAAELEKEHNGEYTLIMAGPCDICSPCHCGRDDTPCPNPDKHFSCMSAFCINATLLAEKAGYPITWESDEASFMSVYLY